MIPLIKRKRSLVLVLKILDCFPSSIKNKKHIFFDFQMCLNHNFREERSGDTTKFAALCVTLPWCTWYTRDHAKPLFSLVQHSIMPRLKYNTTTTNLGSYAKVFSSFPGHTVKFIMDATRKKTMHTRLCSSQQWEPILWRIPLSRGWESQYFVELIPSCIFYWRFATV